MALEKLAQLRLERSAVSSQSPRLMMSLHWMMLRLMAGSALGGSSKQALGLAICKKQQFNSIEMLG